MINTSGRIDICRNIEFGTFAVHLEDVTRRGSSGWRCSAPLRSSAVDVQPGSDENMFDVSSVRNLVYSDRVFEDVNHVVAAFEHCDSSIEANLNSSSRSKGMIHTWW